MRVRGLRQASDGPVQFLRRPAARLIELGGELNLKPRNQFREAFLEDALDMLFPARVQEVLHPGNLKLPGGRQLLAHRLTLFGKCGSDAAFLGSGQ